MKTWARAEMQDFDMGRVPPVTFGAGRLGDVAGIAAGLMSGPGPVLVVADAILATLGVTARLARGLGGAGLGVELAAEVSGEPKQALVDALAAHARATGCSAVIGIGGGAAMDAAKLVAAIAPSGRGTAEFALGAAGFPGNGLPAIAVPTTAGTGSEVTRTAIVSTAAGHKYWYWGEALMFSHAVLDPELTLSLPPDLTAWTGMDAVAHAVEAVTSRKSNAAGRLHGLEALRILAHALPVAVAHGQDLSARAEVMWAATVAGLALHNCNTHLGHNISHALGSLAPVHHGLATAIGLEVAFPWLVTHAEGAGNYARAAEVLGERAEAAALPARFASLMRDCGIARGLPSGATAVDPAALARQMQAPANRGMADNAACPVRDADLDQLAREIMTLSPVAA